MIIGALGIVDYPPYKVSAALTELKLSHTFFYRHGLRYANFTVDGLCKSQPIWPIILDNVKNIPKVEVKKGGGNVLIVVDSRASLSNTNISTSLWPEYRTEDWIGKDLAKQLVELQKKNQEWVYKSIEPSLMDYVNTASKPTSVSILQSLFYKITPYSLRKEVQSACIAYLANKSSKTKLDGLLKSSIKLEQVKNAMNDSRMKELKVAVANYQSGMSVDEVAKASGFATFEILYVSKSAEQNKA